MWYTKFLVFNTYFIYRLLSIQLLSLLLLQLVAAVKKFLPVAQFIVTTAVAVVKTVLSPDSLGGILILFRQNIYFLI